MRTLTILMVISFATPLLSRGQSVPTTESPAPARIYHLLREDDDWSFLADPDKRQDFWDPIKYIRLRPGRNDWFLSMGGEVREVWEQIGNGATVGGRIRARAGADSQIRFAAHAFLLEVVFLFAASFWAVGYRGDLLENSFQPFVLIALNGWRQLRKCRSRICSRDSRPPPTQTAS